MEKRHLEIAGKPVVGTLTLAAETDKTHIPTRFLENVCQTGTDALCTANAKIGQQEIKSHLI